MTKNGKPIFVRLPQFAVDAMKRLAEQPKK